MHSTNQLERTLSDLHGKSDACLIGNATSGITMALNAAGIKNKKVAIPNNVCINVPMAVIYSSNEPLYLDISEDDLGLDPRQLIEHINEVSAVIAVHAYGVTCQITAIQNICKLNNVFLIEDCAVAQGASVNAKPVGSFGDISVVSFGVGKIIDHGHGGAILSDDLYIITKIRNLINMLPEHNPSNKKPLQKFYSYHTDLYNNYYGSNINRFFPRYRERVIKVRMSYFHKYDDSYTNLISKSLSNLNKNIENRQLKVEQFHDLFSRLDTPNIKLFRHPKGSVYWRFNLFVFQKRDKLLQHLLRKRFKVSSWQPSVDLFFADRSAPRPMTPVSDLVGDTIINLWVNDEVGKEDAYEISSEINNFIN